VYSFRDEDVPDLVVLTILAQNVGNISTGVRIESKYVNHSPRIPIEWSHPVQRSYKRVQA
jgi:hypothetical protein